MAAVSADLDAAAADAERDDGASWWARNDDGWYPSRILGFNRKSPTLSELMASDRFRIIGQLTDDAMVQRTEVEADNAEGLWKKVGVVDGISDVSWHKDCTMGGHSRRCCGLTTGISDHRRRRRERRARRGRRLASGEHPGHRVCTRASTCRASRSRRAPAT